ncbi:carboxylate--amine ligase [Thiorhodococcus mannitoliphagus]|uniref:Carboxylate--amine ligase n=1 Tax=Thiorhodococcus mannitoliphagus TaxID=329406 RepID=A0A6P1DWI2_9GAMM|nr:carboxylate--amine ligase [Thiorhodococcus mannitoliphagus]NEX22538.1 carboxylate--amine ligase [Thiorhodococcus mannitoliphagus]
MPTAAGRNQTPLPSIVLGIDTQIGVAVMRELGRAGVRVIGLANRPDSIGLHSRYLERGLVVGRERDERLVQRLRELGAEYGPAVLLAIAERDIAWLIEHQGQFDPIRAVTPPVDAFRQVLDKSRTLAMAQALGIRVPRTFEPDSLTAWRRVVREIRYPAVVKWADPIAAAPGLRRGGLEFIKLEYALDAQTLLQIGQRYATLDGLPMIQEYCPGVGLGQFFFLSQGQVLRRFQHLRIAEWPPEGGFSSVCDAVPLSEHRQLQERSIELLRAIGWEGCAMVEYRLDPASGEAVLMEINGRFWGSFPLAVHAGAGFARLAYQVQGLGEPPPPLPVLRDNLRCRMASTEVKRLIRLFLQPGQIADPAYQQRPWRDLRRFIVDFARPNVVYYVWAGDDPGPFWADLRGYLARPFRD